MSDRVPDSTIKAALTGENCLARQYALEYYTDSFSQDSDILPLVLRTIDEYGWLRAYRQYSGLENLQINEESVIWAIKQIGKQDVPSIEGVYGCSSTPYRLLAHAEPLILKKYQDSILIHKRLDSTFKEELNERLALLEADSLTCLMAIARTAELCSQKKDVDLAHYQSSPLLEAAARSPEVCADWIIKNLSEQPIANWNNPKAYIELMAIKLAGAIRLDQVVSQLIIKLNGFDNTDYYAPEASSLALINIGGKIVVDSLRRSIADGILDRHGERCAADIFGCIHSELAFNACITYLWSCSLDMKSHYANAVLRQYSPSATQEVASFLARINPKEASYSIIKELAEIKFQLLASAYITKCHDFEIPYWVDEYRGNSLWD